MEVLRIGEGYFLERAQRSSSKGREKKTIRETKDQKKRKVPQM